MQESQFIKLPFKENEKSLSLGVELELQVLDEKSLLLTPRAAEMLAHLPKDIYKEEFFQSTIEIITGVCYSVPEITEQLLSSLKGAVSCADSLQLKLGSTGTHPMGDYRDRLITPSDRYHQLIDRNQWLIRRMAVYGMHVHIGMKSGDDCILYQTFFMHFLPHILALSASSPFWQSMYTGMASCRPTTYEALPTAGMPYMVRDWNEFEKLYNFLLRSQAIQSMKDLWWDVRPSNAFGTLELRFADQPATLTEALSIVAFIHLLAHWFQDHQEEWTRVHTPLKKWIFRENKWRAIRHGLDANIVVSRTGKTKSLYKDIEMWLRALKPYIQQLGYAQYEKTLMKILAEGNSATRQVAVFEKRQQLMDVVEYNIHEFYKDLNSF
jgi:carboxylate-amine ligase